MLTPDRVVPFLVEHGLLSPPAIVEGHVHVEDVSRRNSNYRIAIDVGPSFFLKQGLGAARRRTVAHEASVCGRLEKLDDPALRATLPRRLLFEPRDCVLVFELCTPSVPLSHARATQPQFPAGAGRRLGLALAAIHRVPPQIAAKVGLAPVFLRLHRPGLDAYARSSPAVRQLARIIQQTGELDEMLESLEGAGGDRTLIHADLRWENCLIGSGRRSGLWVVDWEQAGVGDPCWDLGTVLGEGLSAWLLSTPLPPGVPPDAFLQRTQHRLLGLAPGLRSCWQAYADALHLADQDRRARLIRAVRCAGAQLVRTAFERVQDSVRLPQESRYLLQLSANVMRRPIEAAVQLFGFPAAWVVP